MNHGKPAMPVQSCWLTHLTYPDIRRFKGKIPLICIGSVPKMLRFMDRLMGGELRIALGSVSRAPMGAQPLHFDFPVDKYRDGRSLKLQAC